MNASRLQVVGLIVVASLGISGCGGSDGGEGETRSPASTVPADDASNQTTATTSAVPGDAAEAAADQWVGTAWTTTDGEAGGSPVVDGAPIVLTSVVGLCTDGECSRGLDLLTEAGVDGPPAPGDYVMWASRLTGRAEDGRPSWEVTDARAFVLAEGETSYLCNPVSDPAIQVLGIGPAEPTDSGSVTPTSVWTIDDAGVIVSPEPSDHRCEVGGD